MRKIYLTICLMLGFVAFAAAQPYNVTLQVDMNTQSPIADTVSVAGSFQGAVVGQMWNDWTPGQTIMTDADMDGVYDITFQVPADTFAYKFLNGAAWGSDEGVPGACEVGGNRQMIITGDTTLPIVCFGMCTACPVSVDTVTVTFQVDMRNEMIADSVTVAGDFQGAAIGQGWSDWTPGISVLDDSNTDSVYTLTVDLPEGTYAYKYVNGTAWGADEGVPSACAVNNNRELIVAGPGPIVIPVHCFASCDTCVPPLPPINVTFQVDMNNEIVNSGGVFVSGNFQDPAWVKDSLEMLSASSNGIYSYTESIIPGEYQFKYFNGPGGDADGETFNFENGGCGVPSGVGGYNRLLDLAGRLTDTILPVYEYNTCNTIAASLENEFAIDFNVYPNPFSDVTTIDLVRADRKAYDLRVINMTGQVVIEQTNLRNNRVQIARNGLQAGMYFVELENEKGVKATRKIVIQ